MTNMSSNTSRRYKLSMNHLLSRSSSRPFLLLLYILQLSYLTHSVFVTASAPQNHRPVTHDGKCVTAQLDPSDFCASVVTYPISSSLLAASSDTVSPRHNKAHAEILRNNKLDLLSKKAADQFDLFMNHHLDSHSHQARRTGLFSVLDDDHSSCETMLQKYLCQNQFPRCFDDEAYVEHGKPIQLTTCYSLCHEVRDKCHLSHRVDCKQHHTLLNHQHIPPTEHQMRFDEKYHSPFAFDEFYRIDCIDSPPSTWKYIFHYLLYGGPGKMAAYTTAALLVYAMLSKCCGFGNESTTAVVARLRRIRKARRVAFESKMRKQQKKYVKLQEIKTALIDQQQTDQESLKVQAGSSSSSPQQMHEVQSSIRERAEKLQQLDELLHALEEEIQADLTQMQTTIEMEQAENEQLGFGGEAGEAALAEAEAELAEQEEDGIPFNSTRDGLDEEEMENLLAAEESVKYFGQRRRAVVQPTSNAAAPPTATMASRTGLQQRR